MAAGGVPGPIGNAPLWPICDGATLNDARAGVCGAVFTLWPQLRCSSVHRSGTRVDESDRSVVSQPSHENTPVLSVIIPASNEAGQIGPCLEAVCTSRWQRSAPVEVIVVANGCSDDTASRARDKTGRFASRGWVLNVIERAEGGKPGALNAGDIAALGAIRVYLDADVLVGADLLAQLADALEHERPRYASGSVRMVAPDSAISRAYARIWRQVPFMAQGVPGCGLFAVNAAGRARWGAFPDIVSDDTFVRLQFRPDERVAVADAYRWPIVSGFRNLVRVRRRQDRGVDEIADRFPDLMKNDDKQPLGRGRMLGMALRDPVGFAVYGSVSLLSRLTRGQGAQDWSRGR